MGQNLRDRLLAHLRAGDLFDRPGLALLAVSGGPDSVALLDLCRSLAPTLGLDIEVGHVDHGIAAESGAVADQVTALAERYGVHCHRVELHLSPSTSETLARRERYRALRRLQRDRGARYLVTAHHADDQAETVLHRLLKGTGMAGLAGIPARGPRGLVRPLLPFTRAELSDWLERRGAELDGPLPVYQDPANREPRHERSWLRHHLLPQLRQRFGERVDRRLLDVARHAADDRRAWAALLRSLPELEFRANEERAEVARSPLARYDKTLSEAILRALAREAGCVVGPRRAARLRAFALAAPSGRVLELGGGWEAEVAFDRVRIVPAAGAREAHGAVECGAADAGRVRWHDWEVVWRRGRAGRTTRRSFSTWITPGVSTVRGVATSDRLIPLGGVGRRKVRRLLMEARVPFRERDAYPVLVRGADVLWVPGVCRARAAVPRPGEPALRVEIRADRDR